LSKWADYNRSYNRVEPYLRPAAAGRTGPHAVRSF
jgi:hypothetical protein